MLILPRNEDDLIDSMGPQTTGVSPEVSQGNEPGENLQSIGENRPNGLPDPAVGGQNGSKIRNGFSTGFRSLFSRTQSFSGAVLIAPAITNPVQGEVGQSNLQGRLYAGVKDQLTQYRPDQAKYVASYVGPIQNSNPAPTYVAQMKG